MTPNKKIPFILKGALGLTLSLGVISNTQAALKTTSSNNDNNIVAVDANNPETAFINSYSSDGDSIYEYEGQWSYGEVAIDIFTGEVIREDDRKDRFEDSHLSSSIYISEIYEYETGSNEFGQYSYEYNYADIWSTTNNIVFSTDFCNYDGFGDFEGSECLNKLDAGTVVDESWFNGTNGYASTYGLLYDEGTDYGNMGNWNDVGATGFVAFAYSSSENLYDLFNPYYYEFDIAKEVEMSFVKDGDLKDKLRGEYVPNYDNITFGFLEITRGSVTVHSLVTSTSVPEPAGIAMFALGLFGLAFRKLRKPSK